MKTIITILLCALVAANAQINLGLNIPGMGVRPFMGFPPSQFFLDVVLQNESQKLLTTPGFPEDLALRVTDTLADAELGFNNCNAAATTLPWVQIRCITLQVQTTKNQLKAIEDEATARAATATAAAAPAAAQAAATA